MLYIAFDSRPRFSALRGLLRAASFSRLHKSKLQRRPRFRRVRVPGIDVAACNLAHLRRQFRRCGRLCSVQKAVEGRVHQRLGALLLAVYDMPVHAEGVHVNAVPDEVFYHLFRQVVLHHADVGKDVTEIAHLNEMFNGAVSEEVLKIATDLNLDGAKAAWTAFAADPGAAITTDAYVSMWALSEEAKAKKAEIDAKIASYTDKDAKKGELKLTGEGIAAYVNAYNDTRSDGTKADMSSLKPEAAEAFVTAYHEATTGVDTSQLRADAPVP